MRAIIVKQAGSADQLELVEMEIPQPKEGELLIKVHAAAINRTDIVNRESKQNYARNPILGVEVSGTVIDANGNESFAVGDKVMGLVNGGAYADYVVMPAEMAMKIPERLSFEEAAAIPEVFLTAYQTLFWHGKLQENDSVLIHAGASGVGTAAIQLAKKLCNATVIVTASSNEKLEFCKQLGADILINYKEQSFNDEVLKATDGQGVDVILDFVGANYWEKNLASIKKEGRWVLIGILGGPVVKEINLFEIMRKYVQITGTLLTPRSNEYKARLTSEFVEKIIPLFEQNEIKPIIDSVFTLEEIRKAHIHMEENRNIGKIIIKN